MHVVGVGGGVCVKRGMLQPESLWLTVVWTLEHVAPTGEAHRDAALDHLEVGLPCSRQRKCTISNLNKLQ